MKNAISFGLVAVVGMLVGAGCAAETTSTNGSSGDGSRGATPETSTTPATTCEAPCKYEGCYWGAFDGGASGDLYATVSAAGEVSVTAGGASYKGAISADGVFEVAGEIQGSYRVKYTGALPDQALGREGGGSWSSSSGAEGQWTATEAPLVGKYAGAYAGKVSGAVEATVACDQSVSVIADGTVMTGRVERNGKASANGTLTGGKYTVSYTGTFKLASDKRMGDGLWSSSSGAAGTWNVSGK